MLKINNIEYLGGLLAILVEETLHLTKPCFRGEVNVGKNEKINPIWRECTGEENMAEYLPKDTIFSSSISRSQKTSAKKAILWLLSKAPHTVDEIADHFGISAVLVKFLMEELICSGQIVKDTHVFNTNSRHDTSN